MKNNFIKMIVAYETFPEIRKLIDFIKLKEVENYGKK